MTLPIRTLTASIALLALAGCGDGGSSEQESKVLPGGGTVKEMVHTRHEAMEEIGDNFKAISDQLKSGSPDLDVVQKSASFISEKATQVGDWFPAETSPALGVDTDTLATVWEKPEEFSAAVARFERASVELDAAAQSGDAGAIGAAFKETGGACKNCHDSFREDD